MACLCAPRACSRTAYRGAPFLSVLALSSGTLGETVRRNKIKPVEFYETANEKREYFYALDLQGRLYLEQVERKDATSCLKDPKMLDFFFKRLRPNIGSAARYTDDYPYISRCGPEYNFLLPYDQHSAFVFHTINMPPSVNSPFAERDQSVQSHAILGFAGTLTTPFEPSKLQMSELGRLYHPIPPELTGWGGSEIGLIASSVAIQLEAGLECNEVGAFELRWGGEKHSIMHI